jgi:hypothetical protein
MKSYLRAKFVHERAIGFPVHHNTMAIPSLMLIPLKRVLVVGVERGDDVLRYPSSLASRP